MAKESSKIQPKPRALPVCLEAIPTELRSLPQWVVWRYVEDRDPETGEIDWDKPPRDARGGTGSSTNARTWSTFEVALSAYQKGGLDGIGFVLAVGDSGAGLILIAVDLDHCRSPKTGEIEEWARKTIAALDSYTEVSPSGEGIRIFLRGKLPPHGRKRGHFETYCTGRYVTVTGQHIAGTPNTIERREAELLAVHKQIWPEHHEPAKQQSNGRPYSAVDLSDLELIERASKAKNGARFAALWNGDTSGYTSQSEADLALCSNLAFWCGANSLERIDGLFRQSGLFRSKWNREDYRTKTIRKALEGRSEFYESKRRASTNGFRPVSRNGEGESAATETGNSAAGEQQEHRHLTDLGNAKRMIAWHGEGLRHCFPWRKWCVWNGARWQTDATAEVTRRVKQTVSRMFSEAAAEVQALKEEPEESE